MSPSSKGRGDFHQHSTIFAITAGKGHISGHVISNFSTRLLTAFVWTGDQNFVAVIDYLAPILTSFWCKHAFDHGSAADGITTDRMKLHRLYSRATPLLLAPERHYAGFLKRL